MFTLFNKTLILFFIGIVAITGTLLYGSYIDVKQAHLKTKSAVQDMHYKQQLLNTMHASARERSVILLKMFRETDPFVLDDLSQDMGVQARAFITSRQELISFDMSEKESDLLEKQAVETRINAPLQDQVMELFIEEEREQAEELLFERAIPGQFEVIQLIKNLLVLYEENALEAITNINSNYDKANLKFQLLGGLLLMNSILFSLFVVHVSRREREKLVHLLNKQKKISQQLDKSSERLSYQATHDKLTGLINRYEYELRLTQLLNRAHDNDKITHAALYLDLDQFKIVNDTCGHHAGDALLTEVSKVMEPLVRKSDVLARLGGDEFGIILEYCDLELAENIAESVIQTINDFRFRWDEKTFRIGVSIGITIIDGSYMVDQILKQIDSACYAAKEAGRNRYHVYTGDDEDMLKRESEMNWVQRIEGALEEDHFILYAQPIHPISEKSDAKISYEILVRMQMEDGSAALPGSFLPAAERYNKIVDLDCWVIEHAVKTLMDNPDFLEQINYCSINLSGLSLADNKLLNFVTELLRKHRDIAKKICFEITETAAINNLIHANEYIAQLKGLGLQFALDDFGSGLSSFGYLKALPVDYLKIDGIFVKDIVEDPIDFAMVKSIHEIGSLMGMSTIAEFVENDEILENLKSIGVDFAQGYGLGKPEILDDIIKSS